MALQPRALQRLHRDIKELYIEPLPGIQVYVDPSNIALMCLILTPLEGPQCGVPLHLCVSFPPSYPHHPPMVTIQTPVHGHPNVFNSSICCDLLRPRLSTEASQYMGGYTPAYLLKYIFLQLLTFFSANSIEQETGEFRRHFDLTSFGKHRFDCEKCGFHSDEVPKGVSEEEKERRGSPGRPANSGSVTIESPLSQAKPAPATTNEDCLHMLNDQVWLIIFTHLSDQDLVNLGRASPTVARDVLRRYNVVLMRELVCFFTRKTFREALLGVGVRLQVETSSRTPKKILHIEAFDMLSLEAYESEHVRQGIWGHRFTHFLPLSLDDDHFMRGLPTLQNFLRYIARTEDLSPTGFLDVIPKLMNTMIVNMMKECDSPIANIELHDDISAKVVPKRAILQASEKAFKGYCLLFHLLMSLSGRFPQIKAKAHKKLTIFLSGKKARNKKNIPDLGEFVAVLPLVLDKGYDWATLSSALVEELLTRNVMWVLKEKPELAQLGKKPGLAQLGKMKNNQFIISARHRLRETFMASRTGLRLMMLQANFMRALVKWRGKLNETYGFPPDEMATHLVELVKRIYVVQGGKRDPYSAWEDFFTILQYKPVPSMLETVELLRTAVLDSKSKGYHHDDNVFAQTRMSRRAY